MNDGPFNEYIQHRATANNEELTSLLDDAWKIIDIDKFPNPFVAIKQIAHEKNWTYLNIPVITT
jgi:hypothetical protein